MIDNGISEIDWGQPARLFVKPTLTFGSGGGFSGPLKAEGELSAVVEAYCALCDRDRSRARIVIEGGFHLDGNEIDGLAVKMP